jgi:hypothetical protein
VQISAPCKTSSSPQHYLPQQETVCSLDIASLKNLSRLAQVESNHASGKVDASGMPCILSEIHSHEHLKFSISNKVKKKEEEI